MTRDWEKQRRSEIRDAAREQKRFEKMRVDNPQPELSLKDRGPEASADGNRADQRRRATELHAA